MVFALDIGSSYVKAGLIATPRDFPGPRGSNSSHLLGYFHQALPLDRQNVQSWQDVLAGSFEIIRKLPAPLLLEALAFSSHNPCLVAVSAEGEQIGPTIHRTDSRLRYYRDGQSYFMPLARLLWSQLDQRQKSRVRRLLTPSNYLSYLLTGQSELPVPKVYRREFWSAPPTSGSRFSELDSEFYGFLPELIDFEISPGPLLPSIISRFGLEAYIRTEVPVFCPGVDFFAAQIASHLDPQLLYNRSGTSEGYHSIVPSRKKISQVPPHFLIHPHILHHRDVLSSVQEGVGPLFDKLLRRWLHESKHLPLEADEQRQREIFLQEMFDEPIFHSQSVIRSCKSSIEKQNRFFYPEELWRNTVDLPLQAQAARIFHCIAILFKFRCDTLLDTCGKKEPKYRKAIISGGQAYSETWLRFKAKRSNMELLVPQVPDTELLGCAAIAFFRLGYVPSIQTACSQLLTIKSKIGNTGKA